MALPPPRIQIKHTEANNNQPSGLLPGELAVEMGVPTRLWVGVPPTLDSTMQKLLFDNSYDIFIGDNPPPVVVQGTPWWESDSGILWVWYNDGNSSQWVQVGGPPVA